MNPEGAIAERIRMTVDPIDPWPLEGAPSQATGYDQASNIISYVLLIT